MPQKRIKNKKYRRKGTKRVGGKSKRNITQKNIGGRANALKKMNCSPMIQKLAISGSCYTPNILNQIKDAYNSHHEDKITETDTQKIWQQLKEKIDCNAEDCWLNEIDDPTLRKRIDRYVFAPDKPPEWNTNKNEWLSNYDIMDVLEQYEQTHPDFDFIGPSPIDFDTMTSSNKCVWDELCNFSLKRHINNGKTKIGIIFNLDKHYQDGSHWVSLYIDIDLGIIFYFDSAGDKIPNEINILKNRILKQNRELNKPAMKFYQNAPNAHQKGTTECGVYSLFFIITMLTGNTEFNKNMSMENRIHLFKNKKLDDAYIEKYRNIYFNG